MADRFTRVYSLDRGLFCDKSPYIICAGAIQRDNVTGRKYGQFRIKNVSNKTIRAVKVSILCYDINKKPLGKAVDYQYLGLNTKHGTDFGQKKLIPLPKKTKSIFPKVTEIEYLDGSVWKYSGEKLYYLPKPDPLDSVIYDEELRKQFKIKFGEKSKYYPKQYSNLWLCSCGSAVFNSSDTCYNCGNKKTELLSLDIEKLKVERNERIIKEKENRARKAEIIKKTIIISLILGILLTGIIIGVKKYKTAKALENTYNTAVQEVNNNNYEKAISLFTELGDYKDSKVQIVLAESKKIEYERAQREAQEKQKEEEKKEEEYQRAVGLINNEDSSDDDEAYQYFMEHKGYKDSSTIIEGFKYLPLSYEKIDVTDNKNETIDYKYKYDYNNFGKIRKTNKSVETKKGTYEYEVNYIYNEDGNLIYINDQNGFDNSYAYQKNKLDTIEDRTSRMNGVYSFCKTYFDENNDVIKQEDYEGNKLTQRITYDYNKNDQGEIESIKWKQETIKNKKSEYNEGEIEVNTGELVPIQIDIQNTQNGNLYFQYNDGNKITIWKCNFENNELELGQEKCLDARGNINESIGYLEKEQLWHEIYENKYDLKGGLILQLLKMDDGSNVKIRYYYGMVYAPLLNKNLEITHFPAAVSYEGYLN